MPVPLAGAVEPQPVPELAPQAALTPETSVVEANGPAPQTEAALTAPEAQPEAEPVAVVLTPPDPTRPKRAGWWSKAKAALGGS